MEFWGAEVKAGEPLKVTPVDGTVLHLSQACLGEAKKLPESVVVYGKVEEQKLVLGHLIPGKIPQLSFDIVFDKEFELSHNWKNGTIHFAGYQSEMGDEEYPVLSATEGLKDDFDSSDEEEKELMIAEQNGKIKNKSAPTKNIVVKPESSGNAKAKNEEPKDESDEDDSEDDSIDSDEMDDSDDENEDESDEEDEETPTPKKPESKKRVQVSGSAKTPVAAKKAKLDATTPQKTDAKKGGHTDTPHPGKKGKSPATDKSKAQTPKSAGGFSCGPCSKSFTSNLGLQSHNKAKHSAGK